MVGQSSKFIIDLYLKQSKKVLLCVSEMHYRITLSIQCISLLTMIQRKQVTFTYLPLRKAKGALAPAVLHGLNLHKCYSRL